MRKMSCGFAMFDEGALERIVEEKICNFLVFELKLANKGKGVIYE